MILGNCYFHSIYWNYRGEIKNNPIKHNEIISSKELGMLLQNNNKMQRCINGTSGIFYYESDLWNKTELKRILHKLIDDTLGTDNI